MAAIDYSGCVQTVDVPVIPGWQTTHNCFHTFQGAHRVYQSGCPGHGINHDRIPSLMEVCLILEQHMFKSQLWNPLDKKHFQMGDNQDQKSEASIYADRRQLLMNIAMYTYDFNESLVMNDRTRIHSTTEAINDSVSDMDLANIMPLSITDLIVTFLNPDYHYAERDRLYLSNKMTDEQKMNLSRQAQRMLLANQNKTKFISMNSEEKEVESKVPESDVLSIRDTSAMPGLFWDLHMYGQGGLSVLFDDTINIGSVSEDFHCIHFDPQIDLDFGHIPTPPIRAFSKTGSRFVTLNVLFASIGDEMWMGIQSLEHLFFTEWPRNPKKGVYFYGGRRSIIAAECSKRLDIKSKPRSDGCWGNIQHDSKTSLFNTVHLPYYQPGDWVSFKIDTLCLSFDVWLNNMLIICNVDCSDIPMPWTFVTGVDKKDDRIYIEQATDICGGVCEGYVDGLHYG